MTGFKLWAWTAAAIGFGLFLGTYEIGRKTPFEHAKRAWKAQVESPSVGSVKRRIGEVVEDAHDKLASDDERPRERHSPQDRAAVDRIISNGSASKRR